MPGARHWPKSIREYCYSAPNFPLQLPRCLAPTPTFRLFLRCLSLHGIHLARSLPSRRPSTSLRAPLVVAMAKSPVAVGSREQFTGILKSHRIVVADCEQTPPPSPAVAVLARLGVAAGCGAGT